MTLDHQHQKRTLGEIARVLKSANAGASRITFDIFFDEVGDLQSARSVLTPKLVGELYGVAAGSVEVFPIEALRALKITIPRSSFLGSVDERDFDGVQQHVFLLDVLI